MTDQFMYVPSFHFQPIPGCKKYRFTADYLLNLGFIPTHWMNEETLAGENFRVNCLIASADAAGTIAKFLDENK